MEVHFICKPEATYTNKSIEVRGRFYPLGSDNTEVKLLAFK